MGEGDETFRVVACSSCGFSFLSNPPADTLSRYSASYFAQPVASRLLKRLAQNILLHEARRLSRLVPGASRILEIGPGHGQFLDALVRVHPHAELWGFDISREARLEGKADSRVGIRFAPSLGEAGFHRGQFDLIVMRHVLEDVPNLRSFLGELQEVGSDSCALYAKVPNRASLAARAFGRYWYGYDFPRHNFYFTPRHLTRLLNEVGFEVGRARHESDAVDWAGSLRFLSSALLSPRGAGGSHLARVLFLAARVGFLPLGLATRLTRSSSRIWVVARNAAG